MKNTTTFKDKLMEPYWIQKDAYCYTIWEEVHPDLNHFKANENSTSREKQLYHYPTFEMAFKKLVDLKMSNESCNTLKEYLNKLETLNNQIINYVKEFDS